MFVCVCRFSLCCGRHLPAAGFLYESIALRLAGRSRRSASRVLWQTRLRSNRQPAAAPGRRAAPLRRRPVRSAAGFSGVKFGPSGPCGPRPPPGGGPPFVTELGVRSAGCAPMAAFYPHTLFAVPVRTRRSPQPPAFAKVFSSKLGPSGPSGPQLRPAKARCSRLQVCSRVRFASCSPSGFVTFYRSRQRQRRRVAVAGRRRGVLLRTRSRSGRQPATAPGRRAAISRCSKASPSARLRASPELRSVRQDRAGRSLRPAEARRS